MPVADVPNASYEGHTVHMYTKNAMYPYNSIQYYSSIKHTFIIKHSKYHV